VIALCYIPEKPNPLTPFPAREGGTRGSGSPLLVGYCWRIRGNTPHFNEKLMLSAGDRII